MNPITKRIFVIHRVENATETDCKKCFDAATYRLTKYYFMGIYVYYKKELLKRESMENEIKDKNKTQKTGNGI